MLVVTAPKGRRERTVPLHADALAALEQARMPPQRLRVLLAERAALPGVEGLPDGQRPSGTRQFASSLHKLRHWYATSVYAASLDLRLTQELLGHSSPTTTSIYTAYSQSKAAGVVASLSAAR